MRDRKAMFRMTNDGIETMSLYKRAVRAALKTGAKTAKGIQQALEGTMGAFRADSLTLYTAAKQLVLDGDATMRGGEFALF